MEGDIKEGETIKLKSVLGGKRIFKLKVKEFTPENRMVWGNGEGTRVKALF